MPRKGQTMSADQRAKLSAARRRPTTQAKWRASMRAVYADPAHRKRVSASLHRRHVRRIQAEIAAGTERYPPGFAVLAASSRPEDAKRRGYALYLWRRFRVTVEDVARLYDDQDRRCGWCRKSITFGAGHYKRPARWG